MRLVVEQKARVEVEFSVPYGLRATISLVSLTLSLFGIKEKKRGGLSFFRYKVIWLVVAFSLILLVALLF